MAARPNWVVRKWRGIGRFFALDAFRKTRLNAGVRKRNRLARTVDALRVEEQALGEDVGRWKEIEEARKLRGKLSRKIWSPERAGKKVTALGDAITKTQQQIVHYERVIANLDKHIARLEGYKSPAEREMVALTEKRVAEDRNTAVKRLKDLERQLRETEGERTIALERLDALNEEKRTLTEKGVKLDEEIKPLRTTVAASEEELKRLDAHLKELGEARIRVVELMRKATAELEAELKRAKAEPDGARKVQLMQEITAARADLAELDKSRKRLEGEIFDANALVRRATQERDEAQRRLNALITQREAYERRADEVKKSMPAATADAKEAGADVAQMRAELSTLRGRVTQLDADLRKAQQTAARVEPLERERTSAVTARDAAIVERDAAKVELTRVRQQLSARAPGTGETDKVTKFNELMAAAMRESYKVGRSWSNDYSNYYVILGRAGAVNIGVGASGKYIGLFLKGLAESEIVTGMAARARLRNAFYTRWINAKSHNKVLYNGYDGYNLFVLAQYFPEHMVELSEIFMKSLPNIEKLSLDAGEKTNLDEAKKFFSTTVPGR